MLKSQGVNELLEESISRSKEGELVWKADPLLRQILKEFSGSNKLEKYVDVIQRYLSEGIRIVDFWDESYPERLRHISNPPLLLFIRGKRFPGSAPVAIVGTRQASSTGLKLSHDFAGFLAERGHTIVSGLAWGIDSAAHQGALDAAGSTVAILAGHIEHVYPKENTKLARAIMENGSLVSEISRFAWMHKGRFVERNRITSGLSEAVIVVETAKLGGTIQQAKFAIGQGRPTYVVDHGAFQNPAAQEGFQRLVEMGAVAIRTPKGLPLS